MAKIIPVPSFDCVVFGATGDLTLRKLLPALYARFRDRQMPADSRVIAAARSPLDDAQYRERAAEALGRHVPKTELDPAVAARFYAQLRYARLDGTSDQGWDSLAATLGEMPPERIRVFYLATSPDLYGPICHQLGQNGLVTPQSRVVLEKPIGHDLDSARAINDEVGRVFDETQIFRIDHYLGKETVQNLLALRFANTIFERLWNTDVIEHVQITVGETVGVEGRGGYYDKSGALRDMLQNHMLQLLCLLAMEPPVSLDADAVRDEKLKVLRALKPIQPHEAASLTVRGQYIQGAVNGQPVAGYLADLNGAGPANGEASRTETFLALKAEVRTWRWANVPFYLRTGKRLAAEGLGNRHPVPRAAVLHLPRRRPRLSAEPADHPSAARRGDAARNDDQGTGAGRAAAPPDRARHQFREGFRDPLPRRLRTAADGHGAR